ncbi:class I SAM-dependent methyltransferase [Streptomyces sp. NBC_00829]|uniref:class I SAM-dependent methyltransferase n=1 Tax=Streptomyces sp. NBC_00829 TaxID=2903679 RepID=UPI00386958BA|nr:class I SAM-dependent methyltransferase [Streptomyces sp. NBC_00829]
MAHENLPLSVWELEQFQRHVLTGHGRSAIDVGCGWGVLTDAMARMGLWTTGYDWSPAAIEGAQSLFPNHQRLSFEVHDFVMRTPPPHLRPGSLDVVSCRLVLPYLPLNLFLADVRRWLKPRTGVMYVVVQVWENQQSGLRRGYPDAVIEGHRHGWRHTARWSLDADGGYTALALTGPSR